MAGSIIYTLVDSSYHLSGVQIFTMLENFADPIPTLKAVKTQYEQLKIHTGTDLTYRQYSELLISVDKNHYKY